MVRLLPHEGQWLRDSAPGLALESTVPAILAARWDYLAAARAEGMSAEHVATIGAARAREYPHFTPEQVEVARAIESVHGGWGVAPGVARRLLRDDPRELALGLALGARLVWLQRRLQEQGGQGTGDDDRCLIPWALAVRDDAMAARALATPTPAGLRKEEVPGLIEEAWVAVYRRDAAALRPVAERLGRRKLDRSLKGLIQVFAGIAAKDPTAVVAGLDASLEETRRYRKRQEAEFALCVDTHCAYRGAQWVAPALVAGFDVRQDLPWDAGFHAWTEANPDPLAGLDLSGFSPLLHAALVDLKLPDWFRPIDPPESPFDTGRLVLYDVGPSPAQVTEMLATWRRIRQWPEASLALLPATLADGVPRHLAHGLRLRLAEVGARADFLCLHRAESG